MTLSSPHPAIGGHSGWLPGRAAIPAAAATASTAAAAAAATTAVTDDTHTLERLHEGNIAVRLFHWSMVEEEVVVIVQEEAPASLR